MTAIPVTVRHVAVPTCQRCSSPLRLHASIQTRTCCCCRNDHSDYEYGCLLCGRLLIDGGLEEHIGLCVACQMVAA